MTTSLKRYRNDKEFDRETKRFKKFTEELQDTNERLSQLIPQGSGSVSLAGLQEQVPCTDEALTKVCFVSK